MKFGKKIHDQLEKGGTKIAKKTVDAFGIEGKIKKMEQNEAAFKERELQIFEAMEEKIDKTHKIVKEIKKAVEK